MPTVLRFGGWRVTIYPNDHRPAHVHVIGTGAEAIFNLNCPRGPAALRENYGFSRVDIRRIKRVLLKNLAHLCREWGRIHGAA